MKNQPLWPAITALFLVALISSCSSPATQADLKKLDSLLNARKLALPNGWFISQPGKNIPLGDLPLNLVPSPDKKWFAVTNNGQSRQSVQLINAEDFSLSSDISIPKSWYGLAFSHDSKSLYVSGGNDNLIRIYRVNGNNLIESDSLVLGDPWPEKISPTGLTPDAEDKHLYTVTKEDSALYSIELATKNVSRFPLGSEAYTCIISPDGSTLYISLWGAGYVAFFDIRSNQIIQKIAVGQNPNEMVLTRNGEYLFVACANDNEVQIINTKTKEVIEVLQTSLYPDAPAGSTPNALGISEDESRLYIANADNNSLAVYEVSEPGRSRSLGFIPTGWYPTSVKAVNGKVWFANGKGSSSRPDPRGPNPYVARKDWVDYIGRMFIGNLTVIDEPSEEELKVYTKAVYENTPYNKDKELTASGEEGNPIPRKVGDPSPIKYVFYIIKENRSYDQVLGDMREGNGDSTLCLFPEMVTPNLHAIARNFILLDNFYVNAEVSADGHNWSMAAYANDYVEKTWPTSYGDRGGTYDYEGNRKIAYPSMGFIWDYCKRAGVTYRTYGEFVYNRTTGLESLEGHFDKDFPQYDLSISDLVRFEKWKHDFDSLLAINALPQLSTIRMPNDHTAYLKVGSPTPRAYVGQNDLAVGKLVDYISKSSIWKESAIFILEDDAQNGPDHVDAHRSPAYVISPYVKRKTKVSTMYSTASMLRTIELILGLPPMSQFDAAATPMWECFQQDLDSTGFDVLAATYNLEEKNKDHNSLSEISDRFNLEIMDAVPDLLGQQVIWKSIKGLNSKMPAPVRSAFVLHKNDVEIGEDDD